MSKSKATYQPNKIAVFEMPDGSKRRIRGNATYPPLQKRSAGRRQEQGCRSNAEVCGVQQERVRHSQAASDAGRAVSMPTQQPTPQKDALAQYAATKRRESFEELQAQLHRTGEYK